MKQLKPLVPLLIICLIAAALLGLFNQLTKDTISQNSIKAAQETRVKLVPDAKDFVEMELDADSALDSLYKAVDDNGDVIAYIGTITVKGYKPGVEVTAAIDTNGILLGVNVGGTNFSESAGLGARAKEASFTDQFKGLSIPVSLSSSGATENTIDALSGATLTSNAVLGGVNSIGAQVKSMTSTGALNTASAQGIGGPVAVTIELDDNGAISSITIGDEFFNETEGYGAKALEPEWQAQFIGKKPPLTLSDIDAISGATITSTAVVEAINKAYTQMTSGEVTEEPTATEEPVADLPELTEPIYTAVKKGMVGDVAVSVNFAEDGTITAIKIGDDNFNETAGLGAKALEATFQAQFIGKKAPLALTDIDAIAGATITSTAVVDAINDCYAQFSGTGTTTETPAATDVPVATEAPAATQVPVATEAPAATQVPVATNAPAATDTPVATDAPVATNAPTVTNAPVATDTPVTTDAPAADLPELTEPIYTAVEKGMVGDVAVSVNFAEDGTITAIKIGDDNFNETPGLGAKALEATFQAQFIGKKAPLALTDIDAIAGATITSTAVVDAINAAYEQFQAK